MLRRPKTQFKPKIQTPTDRAKQGESASKDAKKAIVTEQPVAKPVPTTTIELIEEDENVHLDSIVEVSIVSNTEQSTGKCLEADQQIITTSSTVSEEDASVVSEHQFLAPFAPVQEVSLIHRQAPLSAVCPIVEKHFKAKEVVAKEKSKEKATPGKRDGSAKRPKICLAANKVKLPMDKSKVTMFDLLSYNPPLSDDQKERRKKKEDDDAASVVDALEGETEKSTISEQDKVSPKKSEDKGIRVKVGPTGEIVLDEESRIIQKPVVESTVVFEGKDQGSSLVTYASFRNRPMGGKKPRWSDQDTIRFYRALSTVGTDFSMMSDLFFKGERTRLDLRNKFKKEEKTNRKLVDKALGNSDISLIDEMSSDSDNESLASLLENSSTMENTPEKDELTNDNEKLTSEEEEVVPEKAKTIVIARPTRTLRKRKVT